MSVKTLNIVHSPALSASRIKSPTYSIEPRFSPILEESAESSTAEIEVFLDAENPLGCFRGVLWVMAFNTAALLLGVAVWQSLKHLL